MGGNLDDGAENAPLAVALAPGFTVCNVVRRGRGDDLATALAAGRRGDAVGLFMRLAGASEEDIAGARAAPVWPALEALAPTLAHDGACLGDGRPPCRRRNGSSSRDRPTCPTPT
ncbi:hypothetical protein [Virgisporangium ochraceum]|uniref:hypothetical protein n=1 Tax=Virgisporangium ochraceum TaxID=65505 RepID=UPI001EF23131|nr:hypothetical protein [Virgisporangium ochraceum]